MKVKCAYEGTSMQDYITKLATEDLDTHTTKSSILIVDDEAIIRESLQDWLKDTYSVVTTDSGESAIELIKQQDFDIVILDVRLTGKSGLQVLKEVKEIKPNIKSIVITAYPSVELAVEAMQEGAVDYVVKPVAAEELEKLILKAVTKCK
jgi:DNA-binding NtrC family response regulator